MGLGGNWNGQIGDGTTTTRLTPVQIGTGTDWQFVEPGPYVNTVALRSNGTLWVWGDNEYGQLGDGTTVDQYAPVKVDSAVNWQRAAAGYSHIAAVKTDGTLWAWGANWDGQLGDGTRTDKLLPVQVGSASNWQIISAGNSFTHAIMSNGEFWGWGDQENGEVGCGIIWNTTPLLILKRPFSWNLFMPAVLSGK